MRSSIIERPVLKRAPGKPALRAGFTLIEMSIVLVIIGLIVGGIVVGQNLIAASYVRAQITQIEQYNTAANTFYGKFGYLPGDIPNPYAQQFGFQARGTSPGQGDGNGLIAGGATGVSVAIPNNESEGETLMFWVDLSAAHLIDGGFNTATPTMYCPIAGPVTASTTPNLNVFFPAAKIGRGNYIYVYSGQTWNGSANIPNGYNYFGLSAITELVNLGAPVSTPALTVQETYAIDTKIDDGLPQTGRVTATYLNSSGAGWSAGLPDAAGAGSNPPTTGAQAGSSTTCWDNSSAAGGTPGVNAAIQHYSVEISNGSNPNCALSFRFQ